MHQASEQRGVEHAGSAQARVRAELTARGADVVPHGRSSLLQHLAGTHAILERWEQPEDVRLAGLMHSVYATDAFARAMFQRSERERVRDLIGPGAERLAYLFCSIDRRDLFSTLAAAPDGFAAPVRLAHRDDASPLEIAPWEAGDLLVLYMANAAEQTCAADGSPAPWLRETSQLALWARLRARVVPPVFRDGSEPLGRTHEQLLINAYATAVGHGDVNAATTALETLPPVGEPYVWSGLLALAAGDVPRAAALARRGRDALRAWNTPWDKRLALERWLRLAELPIDAEDRDSAARAFTSKAVATALRDARSPVDVWARLDATAALRSESALPPRFAAYIAGLRDDPSRAALQRYPGLTARPWHDPAAFAIVADLERMASAIARECRALHRDAFHREAEPIARKGSWNVSLLYERGRRVEETCARCPQTAALIERHRTVRGPAGLAYFSRLAPGTRIAPHAGPTNLRLRCHLALDVPADCGLRVGGITGTWTKGRCVVFDDSFVHEAWNESDRERVVLIVDLWHPDLSDDEVQLLEGLHRHVAGHAANLHSYWAANADVRGDAVD